jgi:Uncharacterized protein involved in exopolysaccharide biosynthesis
MENKDKETIDLKSIFVKYLRHWKLFLAAFIFSFLPAILYLMFYPKTYAIQASIQLQENSETSLASIGLGEASGLMKSFGIGGGGGSVNIDDEMSILTSNRMLRLMILDLGVNVVYHEPFSFYYMYHDSPLKLTADPSAMENLDDEYRFTVSVAPGNIKVKAKNKSGEYKETYSFTSLPAKIKIANEEFVLDFNGNTASEKSFKLKIICTPASWIAENLSDKIEIEDVSSSSNVLEISHSDHSKDRGKDMINTLVKKYNEDVESYKRTEDNKTMAFVDGRISGIVAELAAVELDIEMFKTKNEITLPEADVTMYGEAMKDLQTAIIETEAQTHIVNLLDEFIKNPDNKYSTVPSLMSSAEGEKGSSISAYNTALIERDRLLKNSTETNPMYIIADNRVNMLREGIFVMIENTKKSYNQALESLKLKEKQMLSKLKTVPAKERELTKYLRDQEILQGVYLMLLQKREETALSLGKQTDRARIIEPAFIKKKPLGPRKIFAAIGMLVFTLVIPVGFLMAKDLFLSIREEYRGK